MSDLAQDAAAGAVKPRPRQMELRRAAVRLSGDLQIIPKYASACVRYLWYEGDVDGQAVEWQGPGFYVRWVPGGTWTILGVDRHQARVHVRERVAAYKRQQRQERKAERQAMRDPVDPAEVGEAIVQGGTLGIAIAKLALAIARAFGGSR